MWKNASSIVPAARLPRMFGWLFVFGLLANPGVAWSLVIDAFDTNLTTSAFAPSTTVSDWVSGPGIVGGERDVTLSLTSGVGVTAITSGGEFAYGHISSSEATITMTWDGPDASASLDATGLGGLDFTDAGVSTGFALSLLFNDFAAPILLTVYTDVVNFSQAAANLPGNIPPDPQIVLEMLFADFTIAGGTGADFANVGAMTMTIDGSATAALDVSLDFIETTTTVPEPSTSLLFIGGLVALAWNGRRGRLR